MLLYWILEPSISLHSNQNMKIKILHALNSFSEFNWDGGNMWKVIKEEQMCLTISIHGYQTAIFLWHNVSCFLLFYQKLLTSQFFFHWYFDVPMTIWLCPNQWVQSMLRTDKHSYKQSNRVGLLPRATSFWISNSTAGQQQ